MASVSLPWLSVAAFVVGAAALGAAGPGAHRGRLRESANTERKRTAQREKGKATKGKRESPTKGKQERARGWYKNRPFVIGSICVRWVLFVFSFCGPNKHKKTALAGAVGVGVGFYSSVSDNARRNSSYLCDVGINAANLSGVTLCQSLMRQNSTISATN